MPQKRTLDSFVHSSSPKKPRLSNDNVVPSPKPSSHPTYPFPVPHLPAHIATTLSQGPENQGREIIDQPDLDLLYFEPFVPASISRDLFAFLRSSLFFYRVKYSIKRGPTETQINTPRFTTVFGVDTSCQFSKGELVTAGTKTPVPASRYSCVPRPIPGCLDALRQLTEVFTGSTFNFCLVNYYASGDDSISYHSDDERFLGSEPAIASFSLGARRDFLMRHKPSPEESGDRNKTQPIQSTGQAAFAKPLKLPLGSGDMVLMRGRTQANWLHSIPKRKGGESGQGRINITFRKALVKGGTENYYKYNVGNGEVYRWDEKTKLMRVWQKDDLNGG